MSACDSAPPDVGPPPSPGEQMLGGEVMEAVTAQLEAVATNPSDPAHRRTLGMLYLANGMPAAAAMAFEQAIELGDATAATYYLLGIAMEMSGNLDQALMAMAQGRQLDPSARQLCWRPGFWLLEDGQADRALALFEQAGVLERQTGRPQADGAAWRIGQARSLMDLDRPEQAVPVLEELDNLLDHFYVDYLLAQARRRAGLSNATATQASTGAIEAPSYPDPWWDEVSDAQRGLDGRIARIDELLDASRFSEASSVINQARARWPRDVNLLNRQSELHRRQGDTKAWVRALKQAVRIEPTHAPSHYNLSIAHQQSGDLDAALNHAYQAVAANESMASGWLQIGRLVVRMRRLDQGNSPGQEQAIAEALAPLDRAFALGVESPNEHLMYGHLLLRGNRLDDAQRVLARLTERPDGGPPKSWAVLSEVYAAQDDHESALKTALMGLNRFPQQPELIRIINRYRLGRPTSETPDS